MRTPTPAFCLFFSLFVPLVPGAVRAETAMTIASPNASSGASSGAAGKNMLWNGTFDAATTEQLTKMGYTMKQRESWGFMNVVTWDRKTNQLDAASDPRHPSGLGKVQ